MKGDICKVDGCENIITGTHGRACNVCRGRKRRYGSYEAKFSKKTIEDKFWPNVHKTNSCHLWTAYIEPAGYGKMRVGRTNRRVHRIAWELYTGTAIPDGLCVLHKCDVRNCVNPEHLFLGTYQENYIDMVNKGRQVYSSLKGEQCVGAKLKEQDVREIRHLLATGHSISSISRTYNVSIGPINSIKRNLTWRHVE